MSALGHWRAGPAGRRSSHVRYAPKATVGHQNAIGRDGPLADIRDYLSPKTCSRLGRGTSRVLIHFPARPSHAESNNCLCLALTLCGREAVQS
jgi:hypothetical protein